MLVVFNTTHPNPEVRSWAEKTLRAYQGVLGNGPYRAKKVYDKEHLVVYNQNDEPICFGSTACAAVHADYFIVVEEGDEN